MHACTHRGIGLDGRVRVGPATLPAILLDALPYLLVGPQDIVVVVCCSLARSPHAGVKATATTSAQAPPPAPKL